MEEKRPLLELRDIGKIYVSESTVAVGIRGVNLAFERGEFVAVTGQSGSGKSTLLNIISGMDSYEEGELYAEGEPTSHYTQADWEKYREKYISFIFQEYNIIDSFTVLENVELSLMHIRNRAVRRERALELIRRVGLEAHIRQKGSQLSGGQKQRTVIARALAKDSPIILADEPTGNLDSETSKEIIQLLREVSRDKLLIVVTHNFEEVSEYATRGVRVFDHAVASDREINPGRNLSKANTDEEDGTASADNEGVQTEKHSTIRNSLALGWSEFKAKPRLSVFICVLLLIASAVLFFMFSTFWSEIRVFFVDENYMFSRVDGRLVVVRSDGAAIGEEELRSLAEKTGAKEYVRFDRAFDMHDLGEWRGYYPHYDMRGYSPQDSRPFNATYIDDGAKPDIGRKPENDHEVMLSVPYFMRDMFGVNKIDFTSVSIGQGLSYDVVGIRYYIDSNIQGTMLMTREGFEKASVFSYMMDPQLTVTFGNATRAPLNFDRNLPVGKIYVSSGLEREVPYVIVYRREMNTGITFREDDIVRAPISVESGSFAINPDTVYEDLKAFAQANCRQASLMYSSNSKAAAAAETVKELGYIAALSNSTYKIQSYMEIIELIIMGVLYLFMWAMFLIFTSFFIRICTKKSMDAFKSDIAIMRSMGIRVKEIKLSIYIRLYACIIPSVILLPIGAYFLYRTDFGGRKLTFLYWPQYLVIYILLLIIMARVARKHVSNLFSESVRGALKSE